MSTGKTNLTSTQFAAKKLLGKAHTSNLKGDVNEAIPSNVSIVSDGVFAESIPNSPGTDTYTGYSASAGGPVTVEKVLFDVVAISDTVYDANDAGGGGDEASTSGTHGYYLKLPSNYESVSANSERGSGNYINGKRVYDSRGGLQLVPPFASNASPNRYFLQLWKGDPTNAANEITSGDSVDWQVDYYSGVIFVQDYNSSTIPVTASAYLYIGKYLNEKISTGTNLTVKDEGSNLTTEASSINFAGAGVTATTSGADVTVTIANASLVAKDEGSNLTTQAASFDFVGNGVTATTSGDDVTVTVTKGIVFSRTAVTSTITASVSSAILGVSASSALQIRLPSAGDYEAGQYFTVKDEAGNSNTNNITILTTGAETIDGQSSIILESPFAAVNLYSDGTSKFFIY